MCARETHKFKIDKSFDDSSVADVQSITKCALFLFLKENYYYDLALIYIKFIEQDMNEPANFGTNEEKPWNWPDHSEPYWSLKCPSHALDNPDFYTTSNMLYISLHCHTNTDQGHCTYIF